MEFDVSRRTVLLVTFVGLLISKYLGLNSLVDDLLILVVGAILGKEALNGVKQKRNTS